MERAQQKKYRQHGDGDIHWYERAKMTGECRNGRWKVADGESLFLFGRKCQRMNRCETGDNLFMGSVRAHYIVINSIVLVLACNNRVTVSQVVRSESKGANVLIY